MQFIKMLFNLILILNEVSFVKLVTLFFLAAAHQLFTLLSCESLGLVSHMFPYFFFSCGASPSLLQSLLTS